MRESIFHTLFACKTSKKIWQLTCFKEDIGLCKNKDVYNLFQAMTRRRNKAKNGVDGCTVLEYLAIKESPHFQKQKSIFPIINYGSRSCCASLQKNPNATNARKPKT